MENITPSSDKQRNIMWMMYGFWGAGMLSKALPFLGILPFVAIIMAFIKQTDMKGTIYESHCVWIIRSFIIGIAAAVICVVLMILPPVGIAGVIVIGVWGLWRIIKGCLRLYEGRPIENPRGFW